MEFRSTILITMGLILISNSALVADSGRRSTRKERIQKSGIIKPDLDLQAQARITTKRIETNAAIPLNQMLSQSEDELQTATKRLIWFRNLCIFSGLLIVTMGLAIYSMWSRSQLQIVSDELEQKTKDSEILQDRITQMQRVESLGMLAGGVAHDFNNLLVGVLCNAELLENECQREGTSFVRERINQIIQAAEKAADLSRQMLAYAGKTQIVKVPADVNSIISRLQAVLLSTAGESNNLELDLSPDQTVANVDPTQIEQILLNLVSNASQASGENADIIIRTGNEFIESVQSDPKLFGSRERGGDFVFLEVQDSGSGIAEDALKHIFDPFYSDREEGRGLGLAVVYGFVKSHNGLIRATTTQGEGTCFRILLPASDATPSFDFDRESDDAQSKPIVESMTVLVVDDEPAVRNTAKVLLESIGWTVYLACDGANALQFLEEATFPIDCVLLDVVMPHMGAKEVLQQMKLNGEKACVVLMSGHSEEQLDPYRQSDAVSDVLSKPFKTKELVEAISSAVGKRQTVN